MKTVTILVVAACVLALCAAQGSSHAPNPMQLLMYRSMFDMGMLPSLLLSGHLGNMGGGGGGMSNNMLFPMMMYGFM